ncbi:hypothetical protein WOLCODRAFT_135977 [Wolfiporia cocos MD-104 SS10]|uniref:GYF domain-containing protein n=1 Tax=Wolfiporia cocos (strain MD-104) TaxID=742152 RepID=A0A2H3J6Z2_WOLCO|nr:hypothetical protein WOLCODRAFT_135977 [Wolfiporia cocos MD-104 SS10]
MDSRPARKRAAVSSSSEDVTSARNVAKKTRFVEPSEDPVNFAEEVDAQLETRQRRGRVKTEGYDSDSSDDGEGVVPSRRPGAEAAAEDEDDDMFAMGEKEEKKAEEGGKKKEEFLRLGDIEGQEFGGNESESEKSEGEDEPEDEDDAERRKKAGMGYELSSFNMREEMEEGKFAADGTYVRSFDPHAAHDRWMEGLDEKEIKKARRNHRQREKEQKQKQRAEEQELRNLGGKDEIEKELVALLKKGETVLEALQRLGTQAKKSGPGKQTLKPNKRKSDLNGDAMQVDKTPKAPSDIDHITHLASTLMSLGDTDIYSRTYEELVRSVRSAGHVDPSWVPPSADVKYEYRWAVPDASAQEGQVFGPFSEEEVQAWYKAGYFGSTGEKVQVRKVGGEWGTWQDIVT